MHSLLRGAAPWRAWPRLVLAAGLALAGGCARYEQKPLSPPEFAQLLERRSPDSPEVAEALGGDYSPGDGLSLAEAELLALYLNPSLRVARQNADVALSAAQYAGLWDDPQIGADVLRILESVEEPWIAGSFVSFSIPISGRLAVAKDQARAEARAAVIEAWCREQAVLAELRTAWAEWGAADKSLEVGRELHGRLRELVAVTNRREEAGELIAAEAVAFRLAEARLRLDLEDIDARREQARLRAVGLLGLLPSAEFRPSFAAENAPTPATADADLYNSSPGILLAAARYAAAEERLRLEVRKQYPDITLGPLFGMEEGMYRLGIGFSVPLPILNANRGGIAEADALREAARAEWERAVQEAISALAQARAALAAAERCVESLTATVVPLAGQQIEQARLLASLGEINTLLVLEALQAERAAALDLIEAEASVAKARAAILAVLPGHAPAFTNDEEEIAP